MSVNYGVVLGSITVRELLVLPSEHRVRLCVVGESATIGDDVYGSLINFYSAVLIMYIIVCSNVVFVLVKYQKIEYVVFIFGIADVGEFVIFIRDAGVGFDEGIVLGFITVGKLLVLPGDDRVCFRIVDEPAVVRDDVYGTSVKAESTVGIRNVVVIGNLVAVSIGNYKLEYVFNIAVICVDDGGGDRGFYCASFDYSVIGGGVGVGIRPIVTIVLLGIVHPAHGCRGYRDGSRLYFKSSELAYNVIVRRNVVPVRIRDGEGDAVFRDGNVGKLDRS